MTRALATPFALALALVVSACGGAAPQPSPAATPAAQAMAPATAPLRVEVVTPRDAKPPVAAWAAALRSAIEARKGELRLASAGETAEVAVHIESVATGPQGQNVMAGALVIGGTPRAFNLTYAGDPQPQAEKLARNLRQLAQPPAAAATPAPAGPAPTATP
jgi:hypothetical protein